MYSHRDFPSSNTNEKHEESFLIDIYRIVNPQIETI